ncbi:hypothetical protein LJC09_01720 [Desulfovibrio sp. OttesenSCG-928-F20]|nr:hypothetical protein [Desulfovibrio sp. OttesenSCG-928-F20]
MPHDSVIALLDWLKERHAAVMACEQQALHALYEANDKKSHETLMRRKAELLAALDSDAAHLIAALPDDIRQTVQSGLKGFADSARNGLRLDSVFYYSALLYPDEHKAGEPDNLALFITQLESM